MDIFHVPNLRDAVLLAFAFAGAFLAANAWNGFFKELLTTFRTENLVRDYFIYAILVTIFLVLLIYIMRKIYV